MIRGEVSLQGENTSLPQSVRLVFRGGYRISAREGSGGGGRDFLGTKLFQELGTNVKKKDQNSRKKVQNSRKREKI